MQPNFSGPSGTFASLESVVCSVCIANFNGMALLDDCIQSILNQSTNFPVEILLHDDASSDGSVAYVREHYPQVKVIASSENVGFCIANNRMVREAQGRYVLLLNNDAALFPGALSCLMDAAMALPTPGILGLPQYSARTGEVIDRGSYLDPFLNAVPNVDLGDRDVGVVIGACLWIDRSLWDELGGFPESFHTLAEDTFLCCRARLAGYPVRVLGQSGFKHWIGHSLSGGKVQDGCLSTSWSRRERTERNKSFTMVVCYPLSLLLVTFPLHVLFLLGEGLLVSLVLQDRHIFQRIYWNCLASLWREKVELLRWRKFVQESRCVGVVRFAKTISWIPHKARMLLRYGWPKLS